MDISTEALEDKTVAQIVKEWNAKWKRGGKGTTLEDQSRKLISEDKAFQKENIKVTDEKMNKYII